MAEFSLVIGSAGVVLLLLAFFLNLFGRLAQDDRRYALMNVFGAGLSCYASYLIDYAPFVVLEAAWALVASAGLARLYLRRAGAAALGRSSTQ